MGFKGTIALSILVIAGLAFVYFYEIGGDEKRREQEATRNVAIRIDPPSPAPSSTPPVVMSKKGSH
jgi:hypothetical protein